MNPSGSEEWQIYRVYPLLRYSWLVIVPFVIANDELMRSVPVVASAVVYGIFALAGLWIYWMFRRLRLEISPSGVRLRLVGVVVETPWSNVVGLRLDRGREAFILAEPLQGPGSDRFSAGEYRWMYQGEMRALAAERRLLPIAYFSWNLHRGKLGAEIKRFAPALAETLDAGPPAPAPLHPETTRRQMLVAAGVIMAGLGFVICVPDRVPRLAPVVLFGLSINCFINLLRARSHFLAHSGWMPLYYSLCGMIPTLGILAFLALSHRPH